MPVRARHRHRDPDVRSEQPPGPPCRLDAAPVIMALLARHTLAPH